MLLAYVNLVPYARACNPMLTVQAGTQSKRRRHWAVEAVYGRPCPRSKFRRLTRIPMCMHIAAAQQYVARP